MSVLHECRRVTPLGKSGGCHVDRSRYVDSEVADPSKACREHLESGQPGAAAGVDDERPLAVVFPPPRMLNLAVAFDQPVV